jgi:hypothetical protein
MQSLSPRFTAALRSPTRMFADISSGSSPTGQARTQVEHRMQGAGCVWPISAGVKASTPLVPFTTGMWVAGISWPIIGPPITRRAGISPKPPQASNSAWAGVPSGTSRLQGLDTAPPLTVTMRETSGRA